MRADGLSEPAILVMREGRMFCRTGQPVNVNDRPMDCRGGLPLDAKIRLGSLQFVITAA